VKAPPEGVVSTSAIQRGFIRVPVEGRTGLFSAALAFD
jgi:hypothetical protein